MGKKDEVISELLLWEPKHGTRKRGKPATTYVYQLRNDTGLSIAELKSVIGNQKEWLKLVNGLRVRNKQASRQAIAHGKLLTKRRHNKFKPYKYSMGEEDEDQLISIPY